MHGVRRGIFSEKQAGKAHGALQLKITGTFTFFIRDFHVSIFNPIDSIAAIFKFQISSFYIQTPTMYLIVNNNHG